MRRALLLATTSLFTFGIANCVSSQSDDTASDADASVGGDATTGGDAAIDDGGSTNDASDSGADAAPPPNDSCIGHIDCPNNVEDASLKLWLRGNIGVTCTLDRVTGWADQSGNANDAHTPTYADGGLAYGPECSVAKINTHDVVSFMAPVEPDAGSGGEYTEFVDETMTVNLSFVNATDYTFFVVHRRAADHVFGLIGQDLSVLPGTFIGCLAFMGNPPNQPGLSFEYASLADAGNGLIASQYCSGSYGQIDTYGVNKTVVDEVVFSTSAGHSLFTNGAPVLAASGTPTDESAVGNNSINGVIGRSFNRYSYDTRYSGDVAEIIGYSTALTDVERGQIEGYLKRQWGLSF